MLPLSEHHAGGRLGAGRRDAAAVTSSLSGSMTFGLPAAKRNLGSTQRVWFKSPRQLLVLPGAASKACSAMRGREGGKDRGK